MSYAVHGEDTPHPDIARSLTNIGVVLYSQGKLDEALERYEASLAMERAVFHGDHPRVVSAQERVELLRARIEQESSSD